MEDEIMGKIHRLKNDCNTYGHAVGDDRHDTKCPSQIAVTWLEWVLIEDQASPAVEKLEYIARRNTGLKQNPRGLP